MTIDDLLSGAMPEHDTTYDRAVAFLKAELANGEKPASEVYAKAAGQGIQERTLKKAKAALGISSFKKEKKWYWNGLPTAGSDADE